MPSALTIQTFGDRINLHLHFLVTEGGVDEAGVFHKIPRIDDSRLVEIFAREVLAFLVGRELLSPDWAERLLSWPHSGFNVHSLVRAKTKPEAERVGKYMLRPVLALERLTFLEPEGNIGYRWGRDGAGQETEVMDYLEFIARVTSHIPDKGQVMVRYYGLYANAHIYRSSEADVCGGEASAVPCLRAGCAHGGRRERGIFLGFDDQEGAGVYPLSAGARGFSVPICFSGSIFVFFVVIDIAERPEVYYQCGQVGRFIGRSRNSSRRGKRKYLSF
jgi:hypothetical protein